jgi:uncharacterized membrane protein YkoI
MKRKTISIIGAGVAAAGLTFGAIAIANAGQPGSGSVAAADDTTTTDAPRGPARSDETPLTGTDAERATAAALEAVPDGTVIRVETDADGVAAYEAHVRKADGTHVDVYLDENFTVVSTEERAGRGPGGPGGPGGRGPHGTPLTGADAEAATAAALAAVPEGTVLMVEGEDDGTYEAHVRKADGTMVEVTMDSNFAVTSVEEHTGRGPGGRHGHGPGDSGTSDDSGSTNGSSSTQSSSFDA